MPLPDNKPKAAPLTPEEKLANTIARSEILRLD